MTGFVDRTRIAALIGVVLTIAAGVIGRSLPVVGNALGGAAYTLLLALIVVLIWPRVRPVIAAGAGTGLSILVELLQLTAIPAILTDAVPPLRWVLGSTFAWADLPWYAVGGLVAWGVIAGICRVGGAPGAPGVRRGTRPSRGSERA